MRVLRRRVCGEMKLALVVAAALFVVAAALIVPPAILSAQTAPKSAEVPAKVAAAPLTPQEKRQAEISADTEKLLRLARELKVEMDKSTKDTLSLSVIRKADEVEKLARSLKERLRSQ